MSTSWATTVTGADVAAILRRRLGVPSPELDRSDVDRCPTPTRPGARTDWITISIRPVVDLEHAVFTLHGLYGGAVERVLGPTQPDARLGHAGVTLAAHDRRAQGGERATDGGAEQHDRDEDLDERRAPVTTPLVHGARRHRAVYLTGPPFRLRFCVAADKYGAPTTVGTSRHLSPTRPRLLPAVLERTAEISR